MKTGPVTTTVDSVAAIFIHDLIREQAAYLEQRRSLVALLRDGAEPTDGEVIDAYVGKLLREAAAAYERALYGDPSLADGEFYAGMPDEAHKRAALTRRLTERSDALAVPPRSAGAS